MHKDLTYIINHVFLPPKLPQKNDSDNGKGTSLIEELLAALRLFQAYIPEQERSEWIPCIKMVGNMLELQDQFGGLVVDKVETRLRKLMDGGTNELAYTDETGCFFLTLFALI
jgi:hypothetical protein